MQIKAVIGFIYQILILQGICVSYLKSFALDTSVLVEVNTAEWPQFIEVFTENPI